MAMTQPSTCPLPTRGPMLGAIALLTLCNPRNELLNHDRASTSLNCETVFKIPALSGREGGRQNRRMQKDRTNASFITATSWPILHGGLRQVSKEQGQEGTQVPALLVSCCFPSSCLLPSSFPLVRARRTVSVKLRQSNPFAAHWLTNNNSSSLGFVSCAI